MSSADHFAAPGSVLLIGAAVLATRTAQAAEPAPLDEEFLEYLAQLEGDEDDWTLFDAGADKKPVPAKPAAPKPAPSKETASKPTPVATTPKVAAEVKR